MTSTDPPVTSSPPLSVDPEGAASRIMGGDVKSPGDVERSPGAVRAANWRARKRAEQEEADKARAFEVTDQDVQEARTAAEVVWSLVVENAFPGRMRPLTEPQAERLGQVMAPLMKKYLPMLASWQYEIAAVLVVADVIRRNYIRKETDDASKVDGQAKSATDESRAGSVSDAVRGGQPHA